MWMSKGNESVCVRERESAESSVKYTLTCSSSVNIPSEDLVTVNCSALSAHTSILREITSSSSSSSSSSFSFASVSDAITIHTLHVLMFNWGCIV